MQSWQCFSTLVSKGCYKNEIRRNLFFLQIWHFHFTKGKRQQKFFLRLKFHKYEKNIKCQYLSKQFVLMNKKGQIRTLQGSFELNK